jgi:hypothetical protein
MTLEDAKVKVGKVAMGDLFGASEAPEGVADNYPFNACTWRDSFPLEWQDELEQVIRFVYHNERLP